MYEEMSHQIARELMSPALQWPNWIVIGVICLISGFGHYVVARLKKSGEISEISNRLKEIIKQTELLTKAQEGVKQQMADSIWRDQKRWEAELDIYKKLVVSLGESCHIYLRLQSMDLMSSQAEELRRADMLLDEQRRELIQYASIFMPADRFNLFKAALLGIKQSDNANLNIEDVKRMLNQQYENFTNAENYVRQFARERLGINS